jgi:hypothetical protein
VYDIGSYLLESELAILAAGWIGDHEDIPRSTEQGPRLIGASDGRDLAWDRADSNYRQRKAKAECSLKRGNGRG